MTTSQITPTDPRKMLTALSECSLAGPGVTRLPFSQAHHDSLQLLQAWMKQLDLDISLDHAGTLTARYEQDVSGPTLLIGSHQDSVRQGGAYDGILGIVIPLCALARLRQAGLQPTCPIEILAFADEEGVRFPTALMGPRALAGTFDTADLSLTDEDGISLYQAMHDFGLNPDKLPALARRSQALTGYLEFHIEQGPVLENAGQALGVVTGICGIERHQVKILGEAAHAGTVPMGLRKDALTAAAELVLLTETICQSREGLNGVVGSLQVIPGAVNVVPAEVNLTLELRSANDATRLQARKDILQQGQQQIDSRNLSMTTSLTYEQPAVNCDPDLSRRLQQAIEQTIQAPALSLPSGATHDASAMADLCPIAMCFVRCKGGISHHPDEYVDDADLEAAVNAAMALMLAPASVA